MTPTSYLLSNELECAITSFPATKQISHLSARSKWPAVSLLKAALNRIILTASCSLIRSLASLLNKALSLDAWSSLCWRSRSWRTVSVGGSFGRSHYKFLCTYWFLLWPWVTKNLGHKGFLYSALDKNVRIISLKSSDITTPVIMSFWGKFLSFLGYSFSFSPWVFDRPLKAMGDSWCLHNRCTKMDWCIAFGQFPAFLLSFLRSLASLCSLCSQAS